MVTVAQLAERLAVNQEDRGIEARQSPTVLPA